VRQGPTLLTVKLEKQQVAVLASYLARLCASSGAGHLPEDLDLEADPDRTGSSGASASPTTRRATA